METETIVLEDSYVVVWTGRNDYYEGAHGILFKDGLVIWEGYACDALTKILKALNIEYKELGEKF